MTIKEGSTDVLVGATFSVTDGVGPGAETCASIFNKTVRTGEVADVSGGALGGGVVKISTVSAIVLDLESYQGAGRQAEGHRNIQVT